MQTLKKIFVKKRLNKEDKEKSILIGLVELYIKTNSPIGSNSLKENEFSDISSATIRNYFADLEKKGLLTQQHSSGGRIPTAKAFKVYAKHCLETFESHKKEEKILQKELMSKSKKISDYLNNSLELLSEMSNLSVFGSTPRFDQDFVNNIKLITLDKNKILCVIITDFGLIKTEILYSSLEINDDILKFIEDFFLWRMNKKQKPLSDDPLIIKLAQHLYNETMVRYIVDCTNYSFEDIYKTGLSKLLSYPEFKDPLILAEALSIFENNFDIQRIMKAVQEKKGICYFIADDLQNYGFKIENIAIIGIPYYISNTVVGSIGLICPLRTYYKDIFSLLESFSKLLSDNLTKNVYKHKITFRKTPDLKKVSENSILLEDKSR